MSNLDNEIRKIVTKEINIPNECKNVIKNFDGKDNKIKYNLLKNVITILSTILFTSGVVFAGISTYQKIWKEPRKYNNDNNFFDSLPNEEISNSEKNSLISEKEAQDAAMEFLNSLGYKNKEIKKVELKRGYDDNVQSYYMVKTEYDNNKGIIINVDAKEGKVNFFNDSDINENSDDIKEEQAKDIAYDTYKKLGFAEGEYELYDIEWKNESDKKWRVCFYKKYGEIYNKYENIIMSFKVYRDKVEYSTISMSYNKFIENSIDISKEKAIEIAQNKEKEFSNIDIEKIDANLSIEKMNTIVYQLENNIFNTDTSKGGTYLDVDSNIRKVWKVEIKHTNRKKEELYNDYNMYIKENGDKEYYVDTTTGEIIGGDIKR